MTLLRRECSNCSRVMVGEREDGVVVDLKACPACDPEAELDSFLQMESAHNCEFDEEDYKMALWDDAIRRSEDEHYEEDENA